MAIASSTQPVHAAEGLKARWRAAAPVVVDGLHLAALWGFAVAQPIYDSLARSAEFFIARRADPAMIVLFTFLVSFAAPMAMTGIEAACGRARPRVHAAFMFLLLGMLTMLGLHHTLPLAPGALVAVCCAIAAGVTAAYVRIAAVRGYFTLLTPSVVVFPLWFLFFSPISHLVFIPRGAKDVYPRVESATPVVFVLFDELAVTSLMDDSHKINAQRFPTFARFAHDAIWFRNASTVADVTTNALPALLSGIYPDRPRQPTVTDYPRNLFTMLGASYRLNVMETITHLCPDSDVEVGPWGERLTRLLVDSGVLSLHLVLPEDVVRTLPSVTQDWQDFDASEHGRPLRSDPTRPAKFRRYIASIKAESGPQLLFVHTIMPHIPWQYLPSGQQYSDTSTPLIFGMTGFEKWGTDPLHLAKAYRRHLLQTGFVDRLLGEILGRLEQQGLYDRALIIVTADHGLSFHPDDGRRFVSDGNYGDILGVPLLIKLPGGQHGGRIDDRSVESVDVLPSIADVLGVDLPWTLDGQSVFDPRYVERPRKVIYDQFLHRHEYAPTPDAAYASHAAWPALLREGPLDNVYAVSLRPQWLWRPVGGLARGPDSALRCQLQDAERYRDVRIKGQFLPVWVRGELLKPEGEPAASPGSSETWEIVIAVNGQVAAVTRTGLGPDLARFSSLVKPDLLVDGPNRVEIYLVGPDERLSLVRPLR